MLVSYLILLYSVVSSSSASEQHILKDGGAGPLDEQFAELVNKTLELWKVPGLAIAVVDGDEVFAEGYGIAEYPDIKATPSTLWYCGSTTKAFTASAISLLIDDTSNFSAVDWTTPISQLIRDDFVLENDYATTHITIEDALSHRTGLPRHDLAYGGFYDGHEATPRDIVRSLRYLPLTFEPRTTYSYCNLMYVVAAHVVEVLTGTWLGDFLKERIWTPLGMESTYFSTTDAIAAPNHLAQGYDHYNNTFHAVPHMDFQSVSGAGSVISNVLDYSKWISSLLSQSGPLSASGYKNLFKGRILINEPESGWAFTGQGAYGLGWDLLIYKGHRLYQHSGGMEAFGADVFVFPDLNYGLVAFGNTAGTSNAAEERLLWHLVDEKLGIPESERFDWNKKNLASRNIQKSRYANATSIYYPDLPSPPLPLSIPLEKYTGTYNHPGYQNFTVTLKSTTTTTTSNADNNENQTLYVDRSAATWQVGFDLQHVSGSYFIAYADSLNAPEGVFKDATAAEFKIGSNGVPVKLGVNLEPEMGLGGRIWFTRIAD